VPALLLMSLPRWVSLAWRSMRSPIHLSMDCKALRDVVVARTLSVMPPCLSKFVAALQTCSLSVVRRHFLVQILAPRDDERLSPPGQSFIFSAPALLAVSSAF